MNNLLVIGILGLSLWTMQGFLFHFRNLLSAGRVLSLRQQVSENQFWPLLRRCLFLTLTSMSFRQHLFDTILSWSFDPQKKRSHLLLLGLSGLSLWPAFLFALSFLSINSMVVMGFGLLTWVLIHLFNFRPHRNLMDYGKIIAQIFIGFAFVTLSFELTMRWSAIIQTWGMETGASFFLADGRFSNLVIIVLLGIALGWTLPFEGWSWIWGLIGVASGQLSLNGAVALFVGELAGIFLWLMLMARSSQALVRKNVFVGATVGCISLAFGFLLFGSFRSEIEFSMMSSEDPLFQKIFSLTCGWIIVLVPMFFALMLWGHWASKSSADKIERFRISGRWLNQVRWTKLERRFFLDKIENRLRLIDEARDVLPKSLQRLSEDEKVPLNDLRDQLLSSDFA